MSGVTRSLTHSLTHSLIHTPTYRHTQTPTHTHTACSQTSMPSRGTRPARDKQKVKRGAGQERGERECVCVNCYPFCETKTCDYTLLCVSLSVSPARARSLSHFRGRNGLSFPPSLPLPLSLPLSLSLTTGGRKGLLIGARSNGQLAAGLVITQPSPARALCRV